MRSPDFLTAVGIGVSDLARSTAYYRDVLMVQLGVDGIELANLDHLADLRRLAVECYRAVECEGMARVDFLLENSSGKLYINEINTIPGFTSISMYPKMWEHSGLPFRALLDRLIELALDRERQRKATRFTR